MGEVVGDTFTDICINSLLVSKSSSEEESRGDALVEASGGTFRDCFALGECLRYALGECFGEALGDMVTATLIGSLPLSKTSTCENSAGEALGD